MHPSISIPKRTNPAASAAGFVFFQKSARHDVVGALLEFYSLLSRGAASRQAPYPMLPRKRESKLIPLPLLSKSKQTL